MTVPSEIGPTRIIRYIERAIRFRAARLYSCAGLRIWSRETVSAVPSRASFYCTVRDPIDTGNFIHRTSDQITGRTATVPMQRSGSKNTREIPSIRCQSQSNLLNWEMVSRSMPVVKLLSICDNQCLSVMACSSLQGPFACASNHA